MQVKAKDESLLNEVKETNDKVSKIAKEVGLDDMPLNCLADYVRYNEKRRGINKKLRVCRYPAKPCPVAMHPMQRVAFNRKDQPRNPLPVYLSNEMIEFKQTLIPGKLYDLPLCIIDYLSQKGTAIWEWHENPDGSKETRKTAMDPRFALRSVYQG